MSDCRKCADFAWCVENEECGLFMPKQKQTRADSFRAMTDDELAYQIALPYIASPPWCAEHITCPYVSEDPTPCNKCALEWLQQEVSSDSD